MFIMYEQHMWGKIRLFISESRLEEHRASLGSASLLVKHHQTVLVTVAAQGTRVGVSGVSYHVLATMSWVGGRAGGASMVSPAVVTSPLTHMQLGRMHHCRNAPVCVLLICTKNQEYVSPD